MANELVNPIAVGHDLLVRLENHIVAFKYVDRQFSDEFAVRDEKIG